MLKTFFTTLFLLAGIFLFGNFALAAEYDFETTSIVTNPASPVFNQECEITITITSINAFPLTDDSWAGDYWYNFENFELAEVTLPEISASSPIEQGDTFTYIITGIFNEINDRTTLDFYVNKNQSLPENRFTNNDLRVIVDVVSGYDLEVASIEILPSSPMPDQDAKINIGIKNNGKVDLITNRGLSSYLINFDDFELKKSIIPNITLDYGFEVGSTTILSFEGEFNSSGEKELTFTTDYNDLLEESDEDNNIKTAAIKIAPASSLDLAIDAVKIRNAGEDEEAEYIVWGSDLEIIVNVKNTGNVSLTSSEGISRRDFYYTPGGFRETTVVYENYPSLDNPLDPDEIFTYTINGKYTSSGAKSIVYTIDNDNDLAESNELNNSLEKKFIVYANQEEADKFQILNVTYEAISSSSLQVLVKTNKNSDSEVMYARDIYTDFDIYRIKNPSISNWPATETASTSSAILVENLTPGEGYIFKVRGYKNDAEEFSEIYNLTMPADDGLKLAGLISKSVNSGAGAITISWSANLLSSGYVYYKLTDAASYINSGSGERTISHSVTISDLEPGDYEYYIESESAESSYQSEIGYFTIDEAGVNPPADQNGNAASDQNKTAGNESSAKAAADDAININVKNKSMHSRLKGKIMLKVEDLGKAYYMHPAKQTMHYLGRPADAFQVMREQGVGITNSNLEKIPVGLSNLTGPDADEDGLPDLFEDAIGADKNKKDTDGDGYEDKTELENGYSPKNTEKLNTDNYFTSLQSGKIFLQVESKGEAWYINPEDGKRYFLGRPADAFQVMRNLGLGISNIDFENLK